jgi:hypothetical protein
LSTISRLALSIVIGRKDAAPARRPRVGSVRRDRNARTRCRPLAKPIASSKAIVGFREELNRSYELSRRFDPLCNLAASGQQTRNRNILVEGFPMQTGAAQFDAFTLS